MWNAERQTHVNHPPVRSRSVLKLNGMVVWIAKFNTYDFWVYFVENHCILPGDRIFYLVTTSHLSNHVPRGQTQWTFWIFKSWCENEMFGMKTWKANRYLPNLSAAFHISRAARWDTLGELCNAGFVSYQELMRIYILNYYLWLPLYMCQLFVYLDMITNGLFAARVFLLIEYWMKQFIGNSDNHNSCYI